MEIREEILRVARMMEARVREFDDTKGDSYLKMELRDLIAKATRNYSLGAERISSAREMGAGMVDWLDTMNLIWMVLIHRGILEQLPADTPREISQGETPVPETERPFQGHAHLEDDLDKPEMPAAEHVEEAHTKSFGDRSADLTEEDKEVITEEVKSLQQTMEEMKEKTDGDVRESD